MAMIENCYVDTAVNRSQILSCGMLGITTLQVLDLEKNEWSQLIKQLEMELWLKSMTHVKAKGQSVGLCAVFPAGNDI